MDIERARPRVRARSREDIIKSSVPFALPIIGVLGGAAGFALVQETLQDYIGGGSSGSGATVLLIGAGVVLLLVLILVASSN